MAASVSVIRTLLRIVGCPGTNCLRKQHKIYKALIIYVYPAILSCALLANSVVNLRMLSFPEKTSFALLQFLCAVAQQVLYPLIFILAQWAFKSHKDIQRDITMLCIRHWSTRNTVFVNGIGCMILIVIVTFTTTSTYSLKDYEEWANDTVNLSNVSSAAGREVFRTIYSGIHVLLVLPDIALLAQRGLLAMETICLYHTLGKLQQTITKCTPAELRHDLSNRRYAGLLYDYELIRAQFTKLNKELSWWTLFVLVYDMTFTLYIAWDLRDGNYNLFSEWSLAVPTFLLGGAQVGTAVAFAGRATELPEFLIDNEEDILDVPDISKYKKHFKMATKRKSPVLTIGGFAEINKGFVGTVAVTFPTLVVALWEKK